MATNSTLELAQGYLYHRILFQSIGLPKKWLCVLDKAVCQLCGKKRAVCQLNLDYYDHSAVVCAILVLILVFSLCPSGGA